MADAETNGADRPPSGDGHADASIDGRRLRRERNIATVIDAVLEMFEEETLMPSIERAAQRSGLSLRSVYRYFPDAEALIQAAIDELWRRGDALAHLSRIGEGPFEDRVHTFATMRVRLYEHIGHGYRAGRLQAPGSVRIRDDIERTRRTLTQQFDRHFRPELEALPAGVRVARRNTGDIMSQFDAIDLLRRARHLTVDESIDVVAEAIRVALTP